jgi:hypothetical protein
MKRQVAAFAIAAAASLQAHADVVFNWVQTGAPSATNQSLPFAVIVADEVYKAGLLGPVTFGAYSARLGVEQASGNYLQAEPLSSDVRAAVRLTVDATGDVEIVTLAEGLGRCNSPPWFTLSCRVGFASSAVQFNTTFTDFFTWGGGVNFFDGTQQSSFTLNGNVLSSSFTFMRAFGDGATVTTQADGTGLFAALSDGSPTPLRGTGYWAVDPGTIPSSVPLPPSAWLMAAGLSGLLLGTRRKNG